MHRPRSHGDDDSRADAEHVLVIHAARSGDEAAPAEVGVERYLR